MPDLNFQKLLQLCLNPPLLATGQIMPNAGIGRQAGTI
jgi:hypothetical protein